MHVVEENDLGSEFPAQTLEQHWRELEVGLGAPGAFRG